MYLDHMWNSLKQFNEFGKAIVRDATLAPKVMMVGRNELIEWHTALWVMLEKIHNLQGELFGTLHFLRCLI